MLTLTFTWNMTYNDLKVTADDKTSCSEKEMSSYVFICSFHVDVNMSIHVSIC